MRRPDETACPPCPGTANGTQSRMITAQLRVKRSVPVIKCLPGDHLADRENLWLVL